MRGLSRLMAAAVAVVAFSPGLAGASPGAAAATGIMYVSPIASGYAAVPRPGGATDFAGVQTTFVVPSVTCSARNATAQTRAGLDGISNDTVERVGVDEACVNAVAFYTAWYQVFPAMSSPGSPSGVAPANFGVVHFTNIIVVDGGGGSGGLADAAWNTLKLTQPGGPHTVAGALPAPYSAFPDHWAP